MDRDQLDVVVEDLAEDRLQGGLIETAARQNGLIYTVMGHRKVSEPIETRAVEVTPYPDFE